MPTPKVSVILLTYNQEQFIAQALDSILGQQVDFTYEVIVGEDYSTDGTRTIVQDYARRYPNCVRPLYHPHNLGPGANAQACWLACTGQYVALLEGDDYWTSPLKLARQVACLDTETALSFCFHYVQVLGQQLGSEPLIPPRTAQTLYSFADFLTAYPAQTGSLLLRRGCCTLPDWLFTTYPIDFPLVLLHAEAGPARLLPEVMGCYRMHSASTWSSASFQHNQTRGLTMYRRLVTHYAPTQHARTLRRALCRVYLNAADSYLNRHGMPREAAQMLRKAAQMPQAYSMPRVRLLASLTVRWFWYQCQPGRATRLTPQPA